MDGYDVAGWESFAVAQVGAAAALCGLIVVAASINITRLIKLPNVVQRLAASLVLFGGVFAAGTILLVPGQGRVEVGIELTVIAVLVLAAVAVLRGTRGVPPEYRRHGVSVAALQILATVPLLIGGVSCLLGTGGGLYWLAPSAVLVFAIGLANAWVALVEILR